jgi:hypothetical protein
MTATTSSFDSLFAVFPSKKRFPWSPDYRANAGFLQSLNGDNSEQKQEFIDFLREQQPSFDEISSPSVKAETLSDIISEFRFKREFEAYYNAQKENLSPANYAKLTSHISDNLNGKTFEEKMAGAENFVTSTLGKQWDQKRDQSAIGPFGNFWHTTFGRPLADINKRFKPLQLHFKAFRDTAEQRGKVQRLVLGTALAGVAAFALLTVALPAAIAASTFAAVATGLGAIGCGGLTAFFASKAPKAIRDLKHAKSTANEERKGSLKTFQKENAQYRNGPELSKDSNDSVIAIHGITESDFKGNALLDVRNGNVLLPEAMHLKYGGCATLKFDRIKNQLLITLDNIDGQTSDENAKMIREIAEACTGKTVGKATVLGTSCDTVDAMTKVLEENAETVLLNNRLADLKAGLPEKMDQILTQALLNGAPREDTKTGGVAQYLENARRVMGISSETHEKVRDGFDASATPALEAALRALTGKQEITFAAANPVSKVATQIMGNVIEDYGNLSPEQKKLALVKAALGGGVPEQLSAYRETIAAVAAREAARCSSVNEKQFERVARIRDGMGESPETSDYARAGTEILKALGIKLEKNTSDKDRKAFGEIAQGILQSTGSVSVEALKVVAAQRDAVRA